MKRKNRRKAPRVRKSSDSGISGDSCLSCNAHNKKRLRSNRSKTCCSKRLFVPLENIFNDKELCEQYGLEQKLEDMKSPSKTNNSSGNSVHLSDNNSDSEMAPSEPKLSAFNFKIAFNLNNNENRKVISTQIAFKEPESSSLNGNEGDEALEVQHQTSTNSDSDSSLLRADNWEPLSLPSVNDDDEHLSFPSVIDNEHAPSLPSVDDIEDSISLPSVDYNAHAPSLPSVDDIEEHMSLPSYNEDTISLPSAEDNEGPSSLQNIDSSESEYDDKEPLSRSASCSSIYQISYYNEWRTAFFEFDILEVDSKHHYFENVCLLNYDDIATSSTSSERKRPSENELECPVPIKIPNITIQFTVTPPVTTDEVKNDELHLTANNNEYNAPESPLKKRIKKIESIDSPKSLKTSSDDVSPLKSPSNINNNKASFEIPLTRAPQRRKVPSAKCVKPHNVNQDLRATLNALKVLQRKKDDDEMSLFTSDDIIESVEKICPLPSKIPQASNNYIRQPYENCIALKNQSYTTKEPVPETTWRRIPPLMAIKPFESNSSKKITSSFNTPKISSRNNYQTQSSNFREFRMNLSPNESRCTLTQKSPKQYSSINPQNSLFSPNFGQNNFMFEGRDNCVKSTSLLDQISEASDLEQMNCNEKRKSSSNKSKNSSRHESPRQNSSNNSQNTIPSPNFEPITSKFERSGNNTRSTFPSDEICEASNLVRKNSNENFVQKATMQNKAYKAFRSLCKFKNCYHKGGCTRHHALPFNYQITFQGASKHELEFVFKDVIKQKNHKFFMETFNIIIDCYRIMSDTDALIDTIDAICGFEVDKTPFIRVVINALINSSSGPKDYSSAIHDIVLVYGLNNRLLTDILLNITIEQPNFLKDCWKDILNLIKRKDIVDDGLVEEILSAAIEEDKLEYFNNVCEDFLKKDCVKLVRQLRSKVWTDFRSKLKRHKLFHHLKWYDQKFNTGWDADCEAATSPKKKEENKLNESKLEIDENCLVLLKTAVVSDDVKRFAMVLFENRSRCKYKSLVTHLLTMYKKMGYVKLYDLFHLMVQYFQDNPKYVDDDMRNLIALIGFNLLPYLDSEKNYDLAANIIKLYINELHRFWACNTYCTIEPYRSNLNEIPQKIVFLTKQLTRSKNYDEALQLIMLPEFELENTNSRRLYAYKRDIIKEFLSSIIHKHHESCKTAIHFFIDLFEKARMPTEINIWRFYNMYLATLLEKKEWEHFLTEYYSTIQKCYKYIEPNLMRAVIVTLYRQRNFIEVRKMFEECCLKDIYYQQEGIEDYIYLKSNFVAEEIIVIMEIFFIKRMEKNCAPKAVTFNILEAGVDNSSLLPELVTVQQTDISSMKFRIKRTLVSYNPQIQIEFDAHQNIVMEYQDAKKCMEYLRRRMSFSNKTNM